MKRWFVGPRGLRCGWKAAAALAGAYALSLGTALGLGALMNRLYGVWGVTAGSISRAPDWIKLISGHWGEWVAIVQNLLLWPFSWALCRFVARDPLRGGRGMGRGLAAGAALGVLIVGGLLLIDGLRMGRAHNLPQWSWELLIPLILYGSAALGGEMLFRGALRSCLKPLPGWAARALGAAAFAALTAPNWGAATLINLLLLGLLLEGAARRADGYLAGAAARFALYAVLYVVAGCGGGASVALYECYPAAHDLLSGGYLGPLSGLGATLALAGWAALFRLYRDGPGWKTVQKLLRPMRKRP